MRWSISLVSSIFYFIQALFCLQGEEAIIIGHQAPASRVLDLAEVFSERPEVEERISARFEQLMKDHQFPVYLVTNASFVSDTPREVAMAYYEKWLSNPNDGLVLYFDLTNKSIYDGRRLDSITPPSEEEGKGEQADRKVPSYLVTDVFDELGAYMKEREEAEDIDFRKKEPHELLDYLTGGFYEITDNKLRDFKARGSTKTNYMPYLWALAALIFLGALLVWFLQSRQAKSVARSRDEFWFPKVLVGTRLGGQYGGGKASQLSFKENSSP